MPCESGPSYYDNRVPRKLKAALCAIMTVLEEANQLETLLGDCDWDEAGVTRRWVADWWEEHKEEDARRREQEREEAAEKDVMRKAIAKLTDDEVEALGIDYLRLKL